VLHNKSIHF